jgi:hypothetical protein
MAIMLAVNSAADKSSCPFGSLRLLDIISLSRLACVSNDEIWGPKPLARQDKAVRSCLPHPNFGRVFSLLVLQACECVFHTELSPFPWGDFQIIDRWMGVSFGYFRFQSAMLLFQLCEMRVSGHPNPPFLIADQGSTLDQPNH